jgi:hypothetical protein
MGGSLRQVPAQGGSGMEKDWKFYGFHAAPSTEISRITSSSRYRMQRFGGLLD